MDPQDRRFLLRLVACLLGAVYGTEVLLLLGKGLMCVWRGGCSMDEQVLVSDFLNGTSAALIALLLALSK